MFQVKKKKIYSDSNAKQHVHLTPVEIQIFCWIAKQISCFNTFLENLD